VTRRALTLMLASVLALGLAIAGAVAKVPYVALKPGPAINTLGSVNGTPVLSISGAPVRSGSSSDGALDLTTVSVADHITLFEAVEGWLSPNDAVIPREIVYPTDLTPEQSNKQNTEQMQQSQDSATTAALTELGIQGTTNLYAVAIADGLPAKGKVHAGDILTSVDGVGVTTPEGLRKEISKRAVGDPVTIGLLRDSKPLTVTIVTVASQDDTKRAIIGITPGTHTEFPIKVDIELKDVGGPSAGLMFALGIVDKLGKVSLTGGKKIAGTGEITDAGVVGPIGGIAQKMRGAKARGATVFLSPAENCAEAKKTKPDGITLIKVSTLKTALSALAQLRGEAPGSAPSC
jgi:PDZ domain-containing protein